MARILLIEDENLLRWALVQRLEKLGHEIDVAVDLSEAVARLGLREPDVVLLDLSLPDGHGLDFFEHNRERLSRAAVIVMTAVGDAADEVRARALGAAEFLTKPVEHQALVDLVNGSLRPT